MASRKKGARVVFLWEYRELRSKTLRRLPPRLGEVHSEQGIGAQLFAFPANGCDHRRPVPIRNAAALFPLLDGLGPLTNVERHLGQGRPAIKNIFECAHMSHSAPDELSGQAPPMIPMTIGAPIRTISPMGRGVTPVRFRSEMAKRLQSARVVAGFSTKKQAADALGVGLDRYEKWETGRTPVPAQYVGPVCTLFSIDANYLFAVKPKTTESVKRAAQ